MIPRVVLDTNILVSALVFGGKPAQILFLALDQQIEAFTSPRINAELFEVLVKKFNYSKENILELESDLDESLVIVYPKSEIHILKDEPDNRIIEAAIEGGVNFIITGDQKFLDLKTYKDVKIVNPDEFLNLHKIS